MGKLRLRKYAQLYLMAIPTIAYFLVFPSIRLSKECTPALKSPDSWVAETT